MLSIKLPSLQIRCCFRARLTLPDFVNAQDDERGICIMVTQPLPARTMLGPYESKRTMQELNPEKGFVLKVLNSFNRLVPYYICHFTDLSVPSGIFGLVLWPWPSFGLVEMVLLFCFQRTHKLKTAITGKRYSRYHCTAPHCIFFYFITFFISMIQIY